MSEGMTLEKLRDRLRELANRDQPILLLSETLARWADIADAHLSQPAQAVDVESIKRVIDAMRDLHPTFKSSNHDGWVKTLTRAISGEKAWRVGDDVLVSLKECGAEHLQIANHYNTGGYLNQYDTVKKHMTFHLAINKAIEALLPASPTPDKQL